MLLGDGAQRRHRREPVLKLEGVHASYGHVHVLRGIDLEVPDGGIVALLGANGAGKSTLLKTISGVVRASRGKITFGEEEITGLDASAIVRRGIVHCPEGRQVFPGLTVRENLALGTYARGDWANLGHVLEIFPALRDRLEQTAGTLSGGEQQMLAIGRALISDPRLLMLDEPSLGLAPLIVEHIFEVIASFRRRNISVLLVEQNAALALEFADRAYGIAHGAIRFSGTAAELRDSNLLERAYLG
jgi:branched-chain amino acid transport system ATP-binding protein